MDLLPLFPSPIPPLGESLAGAEARLWLFHSRGRTCTETDAAGLQALLPGRPRLLPGVSVLLKVRSYSVSLASCLIHVRNALPLLPVLCVLPHARDEFDSEILRLCGILGVRFLQQWRLLEKPDLAVVERVLRQEPAAPDLHFANFLERRGHSVRGEPRLGPLIRQLLHGRRLGETAPPERRQRRISLSRSRSHLHRAGLPPPRRFALALRLVVAGIRVYSASRPPVQKVAASLGYASPFSLSNEMVRYLGKRPRQVRDLYPWEWMLDGALPEPRAAERATRPPPLTSN